MAALKDFFRFKAPHINFITYLLTYFKEFKTPNSYTAKKQLKQRMQVPVKINAVVYDETNKKTAASSEQRTTFR